MSTSKQKTPALRAEPSDASVPEKEMLAKAEKLQKKFQIEAGKIKSCAANTKRQMQAQEKEIESLTEKDKDLSVALSLLTSPRNVMLDERDRKELQHLFETKARYESLVKEKKAELADLGKEIQELERKVAEQKRIAAKVKQGNSSEQLQKRIETLESRLHTITVQYNKIQTTNNELREEIRSLLIQKAAMDCLYKKYHEQLDQQFRRMNADVEQCEQAYEQWTDDLARRESHKKEILQYNIEMQRRNRAFEHMTKLRNFLAIKAKDRSEFVKWAQKKRALKEAQRDERDQVMSAESQEVVYRRLQELAEDGDVDQLLKSFAEKEQKKFSRFSYAIELSTSIDKIQRRIHDVQKSIEALEAERENTRSSSLPVLLDLERNLLETTEKVKWWKAEYKKSSASLSRLKSGMNVLYKIVNYDRSMEEMTFKEDEYITDEKLAKFFGAIERKTRELVLKKAILSGSPTVGSKSAQPPATSLLDSTEPLPTVDQTQRYPRPRSVDEVPDIVDTLELPLDREKLCQLIRQTWEKEQKDATFGRK